MPVKEQPTTQSTRPELARLAQLAPVAYSNTALLALIADDGRTNGQELFSEPHISLPRLGLVWDRRPWEIGRKRPENTT